jgi:hypothetical protein
MSQSMSHSHSTLDDQQLATISSRLEHDPGYAVLCQSPEPGYTVLEFVSITIPDALESPREFDAAEHLAMGDLYGVIVVSTVEEAEVGIFDVVDEVAARRLPLDELDQELSGPVSPASESGLWSPGQADNYPLYAVERVDDSQFRMQVD